MHGTRYSPTKDRYYTLSLQEVPKYPSMAALPNLKIVFICLAILAGCYAFEESTTVSSADGDRRHLVELSRGLADRMDTSEVKAEGGEKSNGAKQGKMGYVDGNNIDAGAMFRGFLVVCGICVVVLIWFFVKSYR